METWRPQVYRALAPSGIDPAVLNNAVETASLTIGANPKLPPVLSLRHLAHYTGAEYSSLRAIVSREVADPYQTFPIRKQPLDRAKHRFRMICVPEPGLLTVQRWINERILSCANPHEASTAFAKGCSIRTAAERHCCAKWLIKLDVTSFFESISELQVFRLFISLGYQPLVSFELARLCTRLGSLTKLRRRVRWQAREGQSVITAYKSTRIGHLPQGAPTSPMLANLAMRQFDNKMADLATTNGLQYSRYADDITLSTEKDDFNRDKAISIIGKTYSLMGKVGVSPNTAKTRISPPGSRKLVLGLLVDGPRPRLTREFRYNLRQHLHYLLRPDVGPARHAKAKGFVAIAGMKNHIWGLIAFAFDIDPTFASACAEQFKEIRWLV